MLEIFLTVVSSVIFVGIVFVGLYLSNSKSYAWYITELNMKKIVEKYDAKDITIAILDTGISESMQEELKDRIYRPYNILEQNKNVLDTTGHGTKITSVIGSKKLGIAKQARIMPIVVCDTSGRTKSEYLAEGIRYAVKHGADIINISMGSFTYNEEVKQAVEEAADNKILMVAAAGDYSENSILYPARYDNVISVTAQSKLKRLYKDANYSSEIDACIPGEEIEVISLDGKEYMSGSSIATAIYTGILALFVEKFQNEKSYEEIYGYIDSIEFNENQFIDMEELFNF